MTNKEKSEIQSKIVAALEPRSHGRLLLAPRIGKTKLIIDIIKRDKPMSILWVTLSSKLAEIDIPKEFSFWKAKNYIKKLTTSTWKSLNKIEGFYDLIVFDEEQHATEANLESFWQRRVSYGNIISMTGTSTKHRDKVKLYKRLNLEILYTLSINDAVDIGILSNYKIKVLCLELSKKRNYKGGSKAKPFITSEESQYNYLNRVAETAIYNKDKSATYKIMNRRRMILNSPSKTNVAKNLIETLKDSRTLIFASGREQAETLCPFTYHGKTDDKDLNLFIEGKISHIAMVNKGGTGYTYKNIDNLVVVQADSDKNGLTSQKITRTLLSQKNYKATVWLIMLQGTKDEDWVKSTLQSFDETKIEFINYVNN